MSSLARRRGLSAVWAAGLILPFASVAWAQQPAGDQGGGGGGAQPGGGGGATAPPPQPAAPIAPQVPMYPGSVAPPPPGQPVGGGNATESSARPVTGEKEDTFDFGPKASGGGTAFGSATGPVFLGGGESHVGVGGDTVPGVHVVRRGDTLWALCDQYFKNPYQWPRVWSFNPQLQNPHWIYPGDQIRLIQGGTLPPATATGGATGTGVIDRRGRVVPDTIFLRDQGYIEDDNKENWGEISGAPTEKMFLSDFDEVYVRIGGNRDVKLGQELTIFRPRDVVDGGGEIVQIEGTIRVDQWNAKDRIARGQIVETLDVIERGARIGPVGRRFEVVAPVRNDVDITARVITSIHPHPFYEQNQVVFLDKGAEDGLKPGNRLFVIRRGDAWRKSLPTEGAAVRVPLDNDKAAVVERVPRPRDESKFPEEVIAELRVLTLRPHSCMTLVTQSLREIEQADTAVARKGY
jgi:hypothetical protein